MNILNKMMRNLMISVGITTLSSILLYMYFRNRINDVESKVEIMFQLVQEEAKKNDAVLQNVVQSNRVVHAQQVNTDAHRHENSDLVDVSDDDEDHGSSSEEVSDSEDEESETIEVAESTAGEISAQDITEISESLFDMEKDLNNRENDTKKINLNIHGSEEKESTHVDNLEELSGINLEVNENLTDVKQIVLNTGEGNEESEHEVSEHDDSDNSKENEDLHDLEEEEHSEEDNVTSLDSVVLEEPVIELTLKKIDSEEVAKNEEHVNSSIDVETLKSKTVAQLKEIAATRKLQKYKSLTKKRLIDLISNSV